MSETITTTRTHTPDTAPGRVDTAPEDLVRATEAAERARESVDTEERLLLTAKGRGAQALAEQQHRVDDARRDLDAAESFEQSLDEGRL